MAYEISETCFLVPDIGQAACAAWVQAWGSIGAIFAAIAIAMWQRHVDRSEATDLARVRAEVVGTAVVLKVQAILDCLDAVEDELRRPLDERTHSAGQMADTLSELRYPEESEVLAVAAHDHLTARLLLRGHAVSLAVQDALAIQETGDPWMRFVEPPQWSNLMAHVDAAQGQYRKARERLMALIPKGAD